MLQIDGIHHIAVLCSDYARSKQFYTQVLGFELLAEHYRAERQSWKADLALNGRYTLELFSFPNPPARLSQPEAVGLRHLAFAVTQLDAAAAQLQQHGIAHEPIRTDPYTHKRFFFTTDPDGIPLEFYETA